MPKASLVALSGALGKVKGRLVLLEPLLEA